MPAYDALIIGGGPAGLSAALSLGRSCRSVLVCDDGQPRNAVADRMHGFLSRDGTPPAELLRTAREQLAQYASVSFRAGHIAAASKERDAFVLESDAGERFEARTVLLSTGVYDELPAIDGVREQWGRSVFVCPYCDGWEVRGRRLAILGKGGRAIELAQELRQWSDDLLVCLQRDGEVSEKQKRWLERSRANVREAEVVRVQDERGGLRLHFSDGAHELCDALFLCAPLRQRYPLVAMLGCSLGPDGNIAADNHGRTGVGGVYAAGDAASSVHQVMLAAASGVCAGMAINEDLLAAEVEALS
ncbi:MAG: NAD(P)/FAD-dependent oxidoreductase [Candidatus Baltobacteraceae bacterium]